MWTNKILTTVFGLLFLIAEANAFEVSTEQVIQQKVNKQDKQAVQSQGKQDMQMCQGSQGKTGACSVSIVQTMSAPTTATVLRPLPFLTEAQENQSGKVTVRYRGVPVTIPASKVTNVIVFPYPIESVGSSKFCPDNKFSANCINPEAVGKGEKQFTVVPLQNQDTDFVVATTHQTFVITLRPQFDTPAYIEIVDESEQSRPTCAEEQNFSTPYVEYLTDLIAKVVRNEKIDGFSSVQISKIYETPDLIFIFKKEYSSPKNPIKIVVVDIINKSKNILQIREDSKLLGVILSKTAGTPLAVSLSREFVQPLTSETEKKGEHITTCIAVVKKK